MLRLNLAAQIRKVTGKKVKSLREKGLIPAVLYGPKIKNNIFLTVDLKEFEKIYQQVGESSLINLKIKEDNAKEKEYLVLIHAVEIDSLSQKPIHIDFYQPRLDEEITVAVPLIFEGEAPAVKELGGTLVKNIHQLNIRALPQNLPHEIKVEINSLKTFTDHIFIKDLNIPAGVKILKEPNEIVVFVSQPQKVEEELAKPVEEKIEEVEKVGEEKKEEKITEEEMKEEKKE
ncbi:MAG: 50S ribosomal protein L25 [Minisyncoccales bacterium]